MGRALVVLANEPRSYREVIGNAIQVFRPHLEVRVIEPGALDGLVTSLSPILVICSKRTVVVQREARAWVEIYPDGERSATISIEGRRYTSENLEFAQLLSIVDAAEDLGRF